MIDIETETPRASKEKLGRFDKAIAFEPTESPSSMTRQSEAVSQEALFEWLDHHGDPYAVSMYDRPPTWGDWAQQGGAWLYKHRKVLTALTLGTAFVGACLFAPESSTETAKFREISSGKKPEIVRVVRHFLNTAFSVMSTTVQGLLGLLLTVKMIRMTSGRKSRNKAVQEMLWIVVAYIAFLMLPEFFDVAIEVTRPPG